MSQKLQVYSEEFLAYRHLMQGQFPGVMSRKTRRANLLDAILKAHVVNSVEMAGNLSASTVRGFSPNIWSDCPWQEMKADNQKGMTFEDDFIMSSSALASNTGSIGGWSAYGYTGTQVGDATKEGGIITIGSDGDNEGTAILSQSGTFRLVTTSTLALNQKMWYESRWARSSITTAKGDFFAGFMAPTLSSGLPAAAQPITTTDDTLMTAGDLLGFHSTASAATRGGPTELALAFVLASGTINYPTNLTTLMATSGNSVLTAGAFVKSGWVFDPNGPFARITSATARQTAGQTKRKLMRVVINNLELPTFLTSDDIANATSAQAFPTGFLSPCFAVMNTTGSTPPTMSIDWVRIAQRANS